MNPIRAGLAAALREARLAGVLWLSLLACALLAWLPLQSATAILDSGPFRESLVWGWDSWAMRSFLTIQLPQLRLVFISTLGVAAAFALLQLFLTGGLLRALIAGTRRPVLGAVVAQSAALFKANLWAAARFVSSSALWLALLVAVPCAGLHRLARNAPPHAGAATLLFWWAILGSLLVLLNTGLRFDLARIALARSDARSASGAYRIARESVSGRRVSGVRLVLFWLALAVAVQALFTNVGLRTNPRTDASVAGLFVFRQAGFFVLAASRVAFFASLLAWDSRRTRYSVIGSALLSS